MAQDEPAYEMARILYRSRRFRRTGESSRSADPRKNDMDRKVGRVMGKRGTKGCQEIR